MRLPPIATALVGAVALASCGSGSDLEEPDVEQQVVTALKGLQASFAAGRVRATCARMTRPPRCEASVRYLLDHATPARSAVRSGKRRVTAVRWRSGSDRATATVTFRRRLPGRLAFVRRDGAWKLSGLGVRADLERSRWEETPSAYRTPELEKTPLACPPITRIVHGGQRAVEGGCPLRFASDDMALLMLTAVGDFELARCAVAFTVHAASNTTATVVDRISFGGPGICAQTRHCRDGETGLRYPWQGDLPHGTLAAGIHLRFDICVNTPLGRARGMLHLRLARRDGVVTATPYDYPIGDRSIQFAGIWDVEPDGFVSRR